MERRLGRGLGALLGGEQTSPVVKPESHHAEDSKELAMVDIEQVFPNPDQPRKVFSNEALDSLRESIAKHGILQPICVRAVGGRYQIVAGERRWRAARLAGLGTIPVRQAADVDDARSLELALVENLQREDLDPIERAKGYQALMERASMTQEQVGNSVGLKRATVANHLRLLDLPQEAQDAVAAGLVSMGHARALLGLPDPKSIAALLAQIVRKELSVREVESLVKEQARPASGASKAPETGANPEPSWVRELEGRLRSSLGAKISLNNRDGYKGQIVLHYHNREELERLTQALAPKDLL